MRKLIYISILLLIPVFVMGQGFKGAFMYANDGHIYFYLYNNNPYNYVINYKICNYEKEQCLSGSFVLYAYKIQPIGPNINWLWEKDEEFKLCLEDSELIWTCDKTDPAVPYDYNQSQTDEDVAFSSISFGSRSDRLWYGEGNPPNADRDGYKKTSKIVTLGRYKYSIYTHNAIDYVYDKEKGWCKKVR